MSADSGCRATTNRCRLLPHSASYLCSMKKTQTHIALHPLALPHTTLNAHDATRQSVAIRATLAHPHAPVTTRMTISDRYPTDHRPHTRRTRAVCTHQTRYTLLHGRGATIAWMRHFSAHRDVLAQSRPTLSLCPDTAFVAIRSGSHQ